MLVSICCLWRLALILNLCICLRTLSSVWICSFSLGAVRRFFLSLIFLGFRLLYLGEFFP